MATGTWPNVGVANPNIRAFQIGMVDASGDSFTERLIVALSATLTAVQAWIVLYQTATQASIWSVTEERIWSGARVPGNADFGPRSGVENGINMSFRDDTTNELFPLRVVAPQEETMEGANDIPNPASDELFNLIVATTGLLPSYDFEQAQYTSRRERRNNPRVSP